MSFLSDFDLRPLELGDARAFRSVGLALGKGAQPVEVAVIEASHRPSLSDLRTLWKARLKGRATPLLMVALYDTRAAICGPAGDQPPAFIDLDPELVERICPPLWKNLTATLLCGDSTRSSPTFKRRLLVCETKGCSQLMSLEDDVRRRADWPEASSRATPVSGNAAKRYCARSVLPLSR